MKINLTVEAILRVVLSALAIYLFFLCFMLVRVSMARTHRPYSYAAQAAMEDGRGRPKRTLRQRDFHPPWPTYPGQRASEAAAMWVNNAPFVNEIFLTQASAQEVTGYYRDRLRHQGWVDVTETALGLQPEALNCAGQPANLQDERYLRHYDQSLQFNLVMERADGAIQVRIQPVEETGENSVLLTFTRRQHVHEFVNDIGRKMELARSSRGGMQWMEARQVMGNDVHNTRMMASALAPDRYFNRLMGQLAANGWSEMPVVQRSQAAQGAPLVAAFGRGAEFAMLMVHADPMGKGSSAVLTTVTDR